MFVAHSAARVRLVRTAFVLAGLIPCAVVVAWAVHLRSASYRESVRLAWQRSIGLPLSVGAIESVRPGVIRARECTLGAAEGSGAICCAAVEVEGSATEVRLRIGRLRCDPAAARVLAFVAREWLDRGARFDRNCIIEVADFAWSLPGSRDADGVDDRRESVPAAVRVECVAQPGSAAGAETRAVRVVRRAGAAGGRDDEVRIVRGPEVDSVDVGKAALRDPGERIDIEGTCTEPLPFDVLAALASDSPLVGWSLGRSATVAGTLKASRTHGRWSMDVDGRIDDLDLAACFGMIGGRGAGAALIAVRRCSWQDGRLVRLEIEGVAGPGRVERRFLEALVGTVGCRPGPAYAALSAGPDAGFDAAEVRLSLDGRGVEFAAGTRLAGALAVSGGRSLVERPPGVVPADRLAWLLTPPGAMHGPAGGPGGWLMSVLPRPGAPLERTSQAGAPVPDRGF